MRIVIPHELRQETFVHGAVNGEEFKLRGGGMGRPHEGEISTELHTNPGPVGFKMGLMGACIITGYPTFSKYGPGTHDLFKSSDGYEYERHLRFDNGGRLDTTNKVTYHGRRGDEFHVEHVAGDFEVNGDVDAPELVGIETFVETFRPAGEGKIKSDFRIEWRVRGGGTFGANVDNEYRLAHREKLPFAHARRIEFDAEYTPETIRQTERLTVSRA